MTTPKPRRVVSPSDIASMAGVSRAAVSNWRAEDRSDFPARVAGSEAKPLFDLEAVEVWLTKRGREIQRDRGERQIWSLLNHFRGQWAIQDVVDVLLAVLVARKLADLSPAIGQAWDILVQGRPDADTDNLRRLWTVADAENADWHDLLLLPDHMIESGQALLPELVRVASHLDPGDLAYLGDDALTRYTTTLIKSGSEHGHVGSRTSDLLANLATSRNPSVVYDPACGIAEALLRIKDVVPDVTSLTGHDINRAAVRIARQRCLLAGVEAAITVADVLAEDPDPRLAADVVIAEPPFGLYWDAQQSLTDPRWSFGIPPKRSAEMAWLQHAVHHLAPGGRAFIITPMGPLFRSGAERAIRTELLRRGCVEAIVGLPRKMVPQTSIQLALWVLCRAGESRSATTVLVIDASAEDQPERHISSWLKSVASGTQGAVPPHANVDTRDVLADGAILTPQRWIDRPNLDPDKIRNQFQVASTAYGDALTALHTIPLPARDVPAFPEPRIVTIKELLQQDAAELVQGRESAGDSPAPWLVTPKSMRDGLRPPGTETTQARSAILDEVTQPGDILITTTYEVRATVDQYGGHLLARGVYRLRMNTNQCDPAYIAYSIAGDRSRHLLAGTTVQRADVRSLEIPLIPLDHQRRAVTMLDAAHRAKDAATKINETSDAFATGILDLVRYNASSKAG